MKEARYLMRLAQTGMHRPAEHMELLTRVRTLAAPIKGKAINLRVTPYALEFDLFCAPESDPATFVECFSSVGKILTSKRLDVPPIPVDPQYVVEEARRYFNEHRFWEVHEVLEGLWKERQGREKQLLQGLILAAAALVHAQKNEMPVTWRMMEDALGRLKDQPEVYKGWPIAKFRDHFARAVAEKKLEFPTV